MGSSSPSRSLPPAEINSLVLLCRDPRLYVDWIPGVAQEGGGGGYHCSGAAGHPKLDSGPIGRNGPAQAVRNSKFASPALVTGSLVCWPVLGVQRHQSSDSHFHLLLGLPYTITVNMDQHSTKEEREMHRCRHLLMLN